MANLLNKRHLKKSNREIPILVKVIAWYICEAREIEFRNVAGKMILNVAPHFVFLKFKTTFIFESALSFAPM